MFLVHAVYTAPQGYSHVVLFVVTRLWEKLLPQIQSEIYGGRKVKTWLTLHSIFKILPEMTKHASNFTLPDKVNHFAKLNIRGVVKYNPTFMLRIKENEMSVPSTNAYNFKVCCWRRLLRVPWTTRRSNQ